MGGDRVLVGRGQEQQQACVVRQRPHFGPASAQQRRREFGGFRGERVDARRLTVAQAPDQFGGCVRIAVHGAQESYPDAFGEDGGPSPRARDLGWRTAFTRWGVHRSHHTHHVTGELIEP